MIPINDLQVAIYNNLNQLDIDVYDEVKTEALLPLIVIGDYGLSTLDVKDCGYLFEWKIDIYTEYEGKKEVNSLVSSISDSITSLNGMNLGSFEIDGVALSKANVYRAEGYYLGSVTLNIEIV